VFWVISVYFNIRNTLPKSGTFLLGHSVHIYMYIYIHTYTYARAHAQLWRLIIKYSTTSFIRINWDGEPSGYAENPDN